MGVVSGIVAALGRIAVGVAISAVSQRIQQKRMKSRMSQLQAQRQKRPPSEVTETQKPLEFGLGTFRPDRALVLIESTGVELYKIGVICGTQIGGLVSYVVDNKRVTVTGGVVDGSNKITVDYRDGSGDGGDYPEASVLASSDAWTSAHRLAGFATIYSRFTAPKEDFTDWFPKAEYTTVTAIVEDVPRYDPRTGVSSKTSNAGVNLLAFGMHEYGLNLPIEAFHLPQFADFATLSDSPRITTPGQSRPLYRINGVWDASMDAGTVLSELLTSVDALMYQRTDGLIGVTGGQYIEPDVTLDDEDLISLEIDVSGVGPMDRRTIATGTYYASEAGYALMEYPEVITGDVEKYGERRDSVDMPFAADHRQAMDIARREMQRRNPDKQGQAVLRGSGIKALFPPEEGIHVVRLTSTAAGFDEVVEVISVTASPGTDGMRVVMDWRAIDPTVYDRSETIETTPAPASIDGLGSPAIEYFLAVLNSFTYASDVLNIAVTGSLGYTDLRLESAWVIPEDPIGDPASYPDGDWTALGYVAAGALAQSSQPFTETEVVLRTRFYQGGLGPYKYWLLDLVAETFTEIT